MQKQQLFKLYKKKINWEGFSSYTGLTFPVATGFPLLNTSCNISTYRLKLKEKGIETLSYIKAWNSIPETSDFEYERKLLQGHLLLPLDTKLLNKNEMELNLFFSEINNVIKVQ